MNRVAHEVAETAETIPNLVAVIIHALVDYPDRVSLELSTEQEHTVLLLRVDPRDVGKVVGKQGRTARSLRTILSAAGTKLKRRYSLDIVEAENPQKLPSSSIKLVPMISDPKRQAKQ
jgi:predicted RNA-binding protein YlqC (UPF0109 family)